MGPYIMDNGQKKGLEMEKVYRSGKMVASTRATGRVTKPMAMVDLSMPMETVFTENGSMTKLMVGEHTSTWMVQNTSVTGRMINNTAMVLRPGQIQPNMKVIMNLVRNTASVHSNGQMDQPT